MRAFLPLLRTRLGVAALMATAILLIVVGYRLFAGGTVDRPNLNGPNITVNTTHEPDDGLATPPTAPQPSVAPGQSGPVAIAEKFAAQWMKSSLSADAWLSALSPLATEQLEKELSGVDPGAVPATKITGPARLIPRSETYAEVEIPMDAGTLHLRLLGPDGRWFVDGVDWSRA